MIQMQTNLDVADNSGARRVSCASRCSAARSAATRLDRRHHRRLHQGSHSARSREEGRRDEGGGRAHRQGTSSRADGSVIRFDSNAAVLINNQSGAGRHPHLRTGSARTARQATTSRSSRSRLRCCNGRKDQEGRQGRRARPAATRAAPAPCCSVIADREDRAIVAGRQPRQEAPPSARRPECRKAGIISQRSCRSTFPISPIADPQATASRPGWVSKILDDGRKVRFAKRSGDLIDG